MHMASVQAGTSRSDTTRVTPGSVCVGNRSALSGRGAGGSDKAGACRHTHAWL